MAKSTGKRESILGKILVPVITAFLVGGTAPWWWAKLVENDNPDNHVSQSNQSSTSKNDTSQEALADKIAREAKQRSEERAQYKPVHIRHIAAKTATVGSDRRAIAFDAFGLTHFEEGSSPSDLSVEEYTEYSVIIITSLGGGDDSVLGDRYRLEFEKVDEKRWQVVWAGSQWRCARGSKAGQWTTGRCP